MRIYTGRDCRAARPRRQHWNPHEQCCSSYQTYTMKDAHIHWTRLSCRTRAPPPPALEPARAVLFLVSLATCANLDASRAEFEAFMIRRALLC